MTSQSLGGVGRMLRPIRSIRICLGRSPCNLEVLVRDCCAAEKILQNIPGESDSFCVPCHLPPNCRQIEPRFVPLSTANDTAPCLMLGGSSCDEMAKHKRLRCGRGEEVQGATVFQHQRLQSGVTLPLSPPGDTSPTFPRQFDPRVPRCFKQRQ
jgi:hypothetical protein